MNALVTGAGGFLGGHIARMLRDRGDGVVALGRRQNPRLQADGIATVQADLADESALTKACAGVDVVFHVAALTDVWGRRPAMWRTNVLGTEHVLQACRRQGVGRLVYTSTPSVVFGDGDLCGVDESQPYPRRYRSWYPRTKAEAEQRVLQANSAALRTVALRPHLIWGPGDPHLIPRVIERARAGRLVRVGDGRNRVDVTYITNAARAHLQACDALARGQAAGRAYFISQGQPVELWPWLDEILLRLDLPPVTRSVSYRMARRVGGVLEVLHAVTGRPREPIMTRFIASQLACSHYFDISAARRDLGYAPEIGTAEGLERLIADLRGRTSRRAINPLS